MRVVVVNDHLRSETSPGLDRPPVAEGVEIAGVADRAQGAHTEPRQLDDDVRVPGLIQSFGRAHAVVVGEDDDVAVWVLGVDSVGDVVDEIQVAVRDRFLEAAVVGEAVIGRRANMAMTLVRPVWG